MASGERVVKLKGADGQRHKVVVQTDLILADHETGASVWDAALLLIQYLQCFPSGFWRGRRVLELGSGTGVVGIACAFLGADVTLSDQAQLLPLLQQNVFLNSQKNPTLRLCVTQLNWTVPELLTLPHTYDTVLVSDCVFLPNLVQPLVNTLVRLTGNTSNPSSAQPHLPPTPPVINESTSILFCNERRNSVIEGTFFQLLSETGVFRPPACIFNGVLRCACEYSEASADTSTDSVRVVVRPPPQQKAEPPLPSSSGAERAVTARASSSFSSASPLSEQKTCLSVLPRQYAGDSSDFLVCSFAPLRVSQTAVLL
eukprot:gnl/Spiro4/9466_TR5012_c0_g1_i1.p1 gnl/Spiro4/9466_TR5012_c0_g1~~gnl/Spiro4/9466_TR5012_c0_g1_i1.p1  ORF type:complete len:336 (+),score=86.62 gnl/Spiro4/9466_TR5012_c0_g1_i1:67-1008(+)